jgi:glycosyltransferase involved in cell wall biosynthesis
MISTIHDGVPETELALPLLQWFKFKMIRRINIRKSAVVTCVSRHNRDIMRQLYPTHAEKFVFIPNPVNDRFFSPVSSRDDNFVLNFGRQIDLKMGALIEVARRMSDTRFVFVGVGEMVKDYGLPNVEFVGFSESVEKFIDVSSICVFPSLSENFPLVGLEAMARGRPVIATRRGFSEYIEHEESGYLLDSLDPRAIEQAIRTLMNNKVLREAIGQKARMTAEKYRTDSVMPKYERLYETSLKCI